MDSATFFAMENLYVRTKLRWLSNQKKHHSNEYKYDCIASNTSSGPNFECQIDHDPSLPSAQGDITS